jgi:formylglycine-generating enzyme required for sulfatase activity
MIDSELFSDTADMRKDGKAVLLTGEVQNASDSDLPKTASDESPKSEAPTPMLTPASVPTLMVTSMKIDDDHRVEGWTPNAKWLLIACLILAALLLMGLSGLLWYGEEHYRKACDEIISQNKQLLEERGGTEYTGIKGELEKGNYKEAYKPLREMVKRERAEIVKKSRKAAEAAFTRKQAEESALERKKAEEAETARMRVEAEKIKKTEQQVAELKIMEEDILKKAAVVDVENESKKMETLVAERKRLEEIERKKAEEMVAQRKRAATEDIIQNSGFDSQLYMVVDLSGGTSAMQYPIAYHKTESDVPGGVQDEAYKTTKLLLRYIAPGTYMMGSPKDQLGYDETQPPTEMPVTNGFFIGVFEVTQKQWELVMGANPSYFEDASASASRPVEQVSCYEIRENAVTNKHDPESNWPANQFVNEKSFMGRLRMKTCIRTFDLPTEIQWEYACRAGTTTALNSGKNITNMYIDTNVAEVGRYYSNGGRGYKRDGTTLIMTAPVGSYKPNAWGLYDMHGNVSEWCLDWRRLYNVAEPKWKGSVVEQYSVLRGGGWDNVAWHCLSTSRVISKPFQRNYNAGFRVLRNKAYSFSSTVSSR